MQKGIFSRVRSSLLVFVLLTSTALPVSADTDVVMMRKVSIRVARVYQIRKNGLVYTCGGPVHKKYIPGSLDRKGNFISTGKLIQQLQKQLKTAKGNRRKQLNKSLKNANLYLRKGTKVCKSGPPDDEAEPTPTTVPIASPGQELTPSPTPKSTATSAPKGTTPAPQGTSKPTSTPSQPPTQAPTLTPLPPATSTPTPAGCIDASGNSSGCFGLPGGVTGNVTRGSNLFSSKCAGCHGSMGARNFNQTTNSLDIRQMTFLKAQLDQQAIADIVVYLNR